MQCSHRFLTELWTFMPRACGFCTSSRVLGATANGRATGRNAADERLRIVVVVVFVVVIMVLGATVGWARSESVRIDVERRDRAAAAPDRAMVGVHMMGIYFFGAPRERRGGFVSWEGK